MLSTRFNAPDSDVVIRSSDGMLFKLHRKNLSMFAEGFPGEDMNLTPNEIVDLSELGNTLDILFQFVYRQPQPDLSGLRFEVLAAVAEAAEKYLIYAAMEICKMHMSAAITDHPMEVLGYAVRHNHSRLYRDAAPRTIDLSSKLALTALGSTFFINWVLYRDMWMEVLKVVHAPPVVLHRGGLRDCPIWGPFQMKVMESTDYQLYPLLRIGAIIEEHMDLLEDCNNCRIRADKWERKVESELALLIRRHFEL